MHAGDAQADGSVPILVSCAQLADTPNVGRCAPGAAVATITGNLDDAASSSSTLASKVWPAAAISVERLDALPVRAMIVQSSGSTAAIEAARTAIEAAMPNSAPTTLGEINATTTRSITELQQLTKIVILVSLVIAGCSLAVSVTTGVNERKRPFSLLRLTGVPVRVLRRVVALETAVPLAPRRGDLGRNGFPGRRPLPQVTTRRIAPTAGSRRTTSSSASVSSLASGSSPRPFP